MRTASNAVELFSPRAGTTCGTARWSPDGQRIAFDFDPERNLDIYVIRASGGKPIPLTTDPADDVCAELVERWQLGLLYDRSGLVDGRYGKYRPEAGRLFR